MTSWPPTSDASAPAVAELGPTLADYADFAITYRIFLVCAVIAGITGGLVLHLSTPERYTSTAHMVIVATTVSGVDDTQADVSIDSALELLRSDQVIGQVAREIDYPGGEAALDADLTIRPITNSRILRVNVAAQDPNTAQHAATAVTDRFFDVRRQGLQASALIRVATVDAELIVVETELERRYRLAPEEELINLDETIDEQLLSDTTGIRSLVTRRAQLHGERAFLDISAPEPGYLSRPATEPLRGTRSGLAVTVASMTTLSLLTAVGLAALHQTTRDHAPRGHHRQPRSARRIP